MAISTAKVAPDGREIPDVHQLCGRCGTIDWTGHVSTSHDLGYCGCPNDRDPTWSRSEKGPGYQSITHNGRVRSQLTTEELCERWDRRYLPDCAECGHPWGLHQHNRFCTTYCGCDVFMVLNTSLVAPCWVSPMFSKPFLSAQALSQLKISTCSNLAAIP
jgi:hypothetical protein